MATLRGQVAIVTGGGRGLGRAVAEALAALGAAVVVASRNAPQLDEVVLAIRKSGGKALAQTADVADERQVQELVLAADRWVGPASILVNNAGTHDPTAELVRSDPALWLRNISINIAGTYLPTRAVLPGMLDRGFGRIVNISASAAVRPVAGWTAYSAAKAGVEQLTRSLALEIAGSGVTVVSYDPGPLATTRPEATAGAEPIDPKTAARAIAYLVLPTTERSGEALRFDDADLARAVEEALRS